MTEQTTTRVELAIDDPCVRELGIGAKRAVKADTFIGYLLTKFGGEQVWIGAQVVANDRQAGLIVVISSNTAGDFDTLDYKFDAIVRWPEDEPLRRAALPAERAPIVKPAKPCDNFRPTSSHYPQLCGYCGWLKREHAGQAGHRLSGDDRERELLARESVSKPAAHACPGCGTTDAGRYAQEKGGLAGWCDDCADDHPTDDPRYQRGAH